MEKIKTRVDRAHQLAKQAMLPYAALMAISAVISIDAGGPYWTSLFVAVGLLALVASK